MASGDFNAITGEARESFDLTLKDPEPASKIFFTVDGSTPTNKSFEYTGQAVEISKTGVKIRAFAESPGKAPSAIVEAGPFAIRAARATVDAVEPAIGPSESRSGPRVVRERDNTQVFPCQEAGNCIPSTEVHLEVRRPDEHVHCTLDGTDPTSTSPVCDGGVTVTQNGAIVKAIVLGADVEPSSISVLIKVCIWCHCACLYSD